MDKLDRVSTLYWHVTFNGVCGMSGCIVEEHLWQLRTVMATAAANLERFPRTHARTHTHTNVHL